MARQSRRSPTNRRILVVDDQQEVLDSVRKLLEREGHEVLTADSGEQALEIFKAHEIHLLLVDYFMPRMTGEQLIREIREFDPYVQIILQTGYSGDKPANQMMAELDIQGYHDKADGPDKLLLWVDVGLKAHGLINRLRERERLQGELVANVSHEFRTPLHIIGGYTDLLLQGEFGELPDSALESLRRMAAAGENLNQLVSDLLKYGKLEAGVSDATSQWLTATEVAAEIERLATLLLEEKDVRFQSDIELAPEGFLTDGVKLRTILRNLVTNAVKFTNRGTISLRIAQAKDSLLFSVSDTGTGIDPKDQEVVFEPFRQVDGSATRQHRGIGLGLALSRKLARVLGGNLSLDSEPGVGSTFTLTLPLAASQQRPGAESVVEHGTAGTPSLAAAGAA
jgi:signal transduction histidine kinase